MNLDLEAPVSVQLEIEQSMLAQGISRYRARTATAEERGDGSSTSTSQRIMPLLVPPVSAEISRMIERSLEARGKTPLWVTICRDLDPDELAAEALRVVLNGLGKQADIRSILLEMIEGVSDLVLVDRLRLADAQATARKEHGPKWRDRIKTIVQDNEPRHRRRILRRASQAAEIEFKALEDDQRLRVGMPLLNAVMAATGLFDRCAEDDVSDDGEVDTVVRLTLTEDGSKLIREVTDMLEVARPRFLPMVVPPKPWQRFDTGCYLSQDIAKRVPLVRRPSPEGKKLIMDAIRKGTMQRVLDSLNAIQATPWTINPEILEAVRFAWAQGINLKKFPRRHRVKVAKLPEGFDDLPVADKSILVEQRKKGVRINRGIDSEAIQLATDLDTAAFLSEFEAFWLPCNLDFRGRAYPVTDFHHQRADHIKGLFRFAKGKPLGAEGARWLAIHLANCGDGMKEGPKVSKLSFEARVEWAISHADQILAVASDWRSNRWWTKADKPFSFLAACLEFSGWWYEGDGFVSHLGIALDGSNSGVQHYSAALRAEEGRFVCLTPEELPQDLYAEVAGLVQGWVAEDAQQEWPQGLPGCSEGLSATSVAAGLATAIREARRADPKAGVAKEEKALDIILAKLWLAHGVDRSVVKRNCMTYAYSSEVFGFRGQLIEDLMEPLDVKRLAGEIVAHPFGDKRSYKAAAQYLAKRVWRGVTTLLRRTAAGMKWFQEVAAILAHEGKPVTWITPLGMPVVNCYRDWEVKRVELHLHDRSIPVWEANPDKDKVDQDNGSVLRRLQLSVRTKQKDVIVKHRQKSAISPNVIHSMDGCHLQKTVLLAQEHGINSFMLIHDSFATHACDTPVFFGVIREAFASMYETFDLFTAIREAAEAVLSEAGRGKIKPDPEPGTLDISSVRQSRYCFA